MSAFPAGDAPRISVVVATYNYDLYLARALDSILAQQEVDFEVLVVDDGSTDQTREIVGRYGRVVTYVRQEHAGVSWNQIIRKWRTASAEPLPRLETANIFSARPKGGRLMLRFFDRVSPKTDHPMV